MNELKPLSNTDLISIAPSIAATTPHKDASDKYKIISTLNIVDTLRNEGWYPTKAQQVKTRKADKKGYQKHLIRFQHPDLQLGNEAVEAVLVNSYDRSCSYKFFTGVFRFICANGMITGDTFQEVKTRHMNFDESDIIDASYTILKETPKIANNINEMKAIELNPQEQKIYADSVLTMLYGDEEKPPISDSRILTPRRYHDEKSTLWNTFNTVQENVMKGGMRGFNKKTRRRITTRPVKNIDKNVKLNKAMWQLTEQMKNLKQAA